MRHSSKVASWVCAVAVLATAAIQLEGRQLASKPAPEWIASLERPDRVAGLKVDEIVAALELKPGNIVGDIGAGPGVFEPALAKAVSPRGKVYAEEIDPAFIDHIQVKMKEKHVDNVVTVLGKATDPNFPTKNLDVVLIHDVLHHVADRAGLLKATAAYLKPGGRIAVVDLPPTGPHKDQPDLVITKDQVKEWMAAAGLTPVKELDFLKEKWFVIYGKSGGRNQTY